ncbi:hypothetical protein K2O51_31510 (plasmid) [Cupriavidus pinatubonensis]|nr:hypothetical protein K2O51_31510 [Cupriavidus pinatubonensis]
MLAVRSKVLPRYGSWHFELKYDGYRMLVATAPFALKTRGGTDATTWFPELGVALAHLPPGAHILDGEVAVLDELGRADFNRLHKRALRRRWYPGADGVVLCAFDLVMHDGRDVRGLPYEDRKARLQTLLAGVPGVLFVESVEDGAWLYDAVLGLKLEGVVAKRAGSLYVAGESPDWLKIKRPGSTPPGRFHREI